MISLRWASHFSEREIFENMVNAVAGYHIMTGEYPDYLKVSEIMDTYSAIPNYGQDGSIDEDGDGFFFATRKLIPDFAIKIPLISQIVRLVWVLL